MSNRKDVTEEITSTRWGAIVIGSGLAGMSVAVGLAKRGKRVLLLEQHFIPGGYATCFKRKAFTFDVSLHQMPALGEGFGLHTMLTDYGMMDKLTPIPIRETALIKTPRGEISTSADFFDQLKAMFPQEKKGIDEIDYCMYNLLSEVESVSKIGNLPGPLFRFLYPFNAPTIRRYAHLTLEKFLELFVEDPLLKQLISIQWGYFGLPPSRVSAIFYLVGLGGFLKQGMYYVKGGSQALSDAFVERLEELDGQLLLKQRVEKILVEGGRIAGVRSRSVTKSGGGDLHEFRAPIVVSNANPYLTYDELLGTEFKAPRIARVLDALEPSPSAFCVYLGLDCPLGDITGEKVHSVIHIDEETVDYEKAYRELWGGTKTAFDGFTDYTMMDPGLAPEGKSVVVLVQVVGMTGWEGLDEAEYKEKKARMVEGFLAQMEARYPGFRSHIEVQDAGSPHTMERYTSNYKGAYNGFAYNLDRVGNCTGGLSYRGPLPGLFHASAWVGSLSGGYLGSIGNGYMVAKLI